MFLTFYPGFNAALNVMFYSFFDYYHCFSSYINILLNVGSDLVCMSQFSFKKNVIVYVGHHKDIGVIFSNVICPTTTIFEKKANFLTFFQKIASIENIVLPFRYAKSEYEILNIILRLFMTHSVYKDNKVIENFRIWVPFVNTILKIKTVLFNSNENTLLSLNVYIKNSRIFSYLN